MHQSCRIQLSQTLGWAANGKPDPRLSYGAQGQLVTIDRAPDAQGNYIETIEVER